MDAWRAYLELVLGLTEASRKKAMAVAQRLAEQSGISVSQLQSLTDELVDASVANREALLRMVRSELERGLGAVGLARTEEVETLKARVRDLEEQLGTGAAATAAAAAAAPASKVVKKTVKKAVKAPAPAAAKKTAKAAPAKKATKKAAKKAGS